ncbi:MAG TPA: nucleoside triphosphate pyrophosphohydrolase [Gemmatimonadota bacterium]|nr:nucleoside triphosphate pyrophosphohydrolase [Gemmatimonadota bacterium]
MTDPSDPASSPASDPYPPTFSGVLDLLRRLREPDGCPWDREQTPRTLLPLLLEEAHEVAVAIEAGRTEAVIDELGDLLLHLAFQIVIAEDAGDFDLADVAGGLIAKMVRRHPHVFGDAEYMGDGHQAMWERLKRDEKPAAQDGVIGSLPKALPGLVRAYRIQQKVSTVGFDWHAPEGAREKVDEELIEVDQIAGRAADSGPRATPEQMEEEYGDLLFAMVNWGRLLGLHPETALQRANRKFETRFRRLEALARERGIALEGQPLEALDALWDEVKELERT